MQGSVEVGIEDIRCSRRLRQSYSLRRQRKKHPVRTFAGHLELDIKWVDFLDAG